MKRANLQRIALFIVLAVAVPFTTYAQPYILQNFTLSDFGDAYDKSESIVWKPAFSEFVVQAKDEEVEADQAEDQETAGAENADTETVEIVGNNPDPEISAVRYSEAKPDGITDVVAGTQKYVLGVKAAFIKQGYNWVELYPNRINQEGEQGGEEGEGDFVAVDTENDQQNDAQAADAGDGEESTAPDVNAESTPTMLPFQGVITDISMWVWGGRYGWWVEVHLRDYLNYNYIFPMGDLMYRGWKQKRTQIPNSVVQSRSRIPAVQTLSFEKIKLWSFPSERVDQLYVYFDLLQYGSYVSLEKFDGQELGTDLW